MTQDKHTNEKKSTNVRASLFVIDTYCCPFKPYNAMMVRRLRLLLCSLSLQDESEQTWQTPPRPEVAPLRTPCHGWHADLASGGVGGLLRAAWRAPARSTYTCGERSGDATVGRAHPHLSRGRRPGTAVPWFPGRRVLSTGMGSPYKRLRRGSQNTALSTQSLRPHDRRARAAVHGRANSSG